MADTLGLILQLILDKGKQQEVKKGLDDTAKSLDAVAKSSSDFTKEEKALKAALSDIEKKLDDVNARAKSYREALEKLKASNSSSVPKYEELVAKIEAEAAALHQTAEEHRGKLEQIKKEKKEYSDLAKFIGITTKELDKLSREEYATAKGAYEAQKQLDKYNKELQLTERRIADVRQASESLFRVSQGLFFTGSSILGAIYLSANGEAQRLKEAGGVVDRTTEKWMNAQRRIERSYQRIGKVAITALLPTLEKVAALASKASRIIERNPDLVKAVVNTAGIVATVGAVGMLVARGVRFYADAALIAAQLKYAASTAVFKASVDKFLLGASRAGGGMIATLAGAALSIVAGVIASGVLVALVNQVLEETGINDAIDAARGEARDKNAKMYPGLINDPEQRKI